MQTRPSMNRDNAMEVLMQETGRVFAGVLEEAGVYKCTGQGREQFLRFIDAVNER